MLTIVGTLFQVGAALLAPKPEVPDVGRRRNRQQRFAPSFGFNSTQELANYGDPINLVYTNQNKFGDVRVAGSLVWSAVDNFGSTQFMRLLLVLGAGEIKAITYGKTALGQTSLADIGQENVFLFEDIDFSGDKKTGPPRFVALSSRFGKSKFYPATLKPGDELRPAFLLKTKDGLEKGFSQTYTPTTFTSLGVYDVIPVNVDVKTRDKDGDREEANLGVVLESGHFQNNKWKNHSYSGGVGNTFAEGDKVQIRFHS